MKKFFSVALATIATILLILVVLFTVLGVVMNDETFINNEFTKLGTAASMGMTNQDLVRSYKRLVDYMEAQVDDIKLDVVVNGETVDMFSMEQEVVHMQDVRQIYQSIAGYRDISVLALLILYLVAAIINFRMAPQRLAQGYLSGTFVFLLLFGFLGTWAATDFSGFWTFFHQMLFWNDLWLFDATESRMINMLPERIFSDLIGRVALYVSIFIAVLTALSIFALIASSDGYRRRRATARARQRQRKLAIEKNKQAKLAAKAEAEKQKRIAQRKAQRAKERAKAAKQDGAPTAKRRASEGGKATGKRKIKSGSDASKRPDTGARKNKGGVSDETGFFDDDDSI